MIGDIKMTKNEEKSLEKLGEVIGAIKSENAEFRTQIKDLVEIINKKVETKHEPISLEQDILKTAQNSIAKALEESLLNYNSPLIKIIQNVINNNAGIFEEIIEAQIKELASSNEFAAEIKAQLNHSIARALLSCTDSFSKKIVNDLKSNPTVKAKMVVAIEKIVEEEMKK